MNELIRYCYEQGWSDAIYNGVLVVAYVVHMLFLMFYRKKFGFSLKQSILTVAIVYPLVYYWMLVLAWVENGFKNWGANNIIRVYVYVPLIAWLTAKILKVSVGKMMDYVAPSMALQQVVAHSVCPFVGCCHGYECSWGVWNPATELYQFPIQWVECLVAAAVFVFLIWYTKKDKYSGSAKVYPMFLLTFGGTRFFLEFLRDNDKLIGNISNLAFHALFMAIVGTVWLFVLSEKEKENKRKAAIKQQKR